ncbi:unnamed protein product [Somion occarium]|uniref:GPI anchored protein n=1 Tax=Somion occarium TaxID=3059160 RepID=A0ABP1CQ47_9APHY
MIPSTSTLLSLLLAAAYVVAIPAEPSISTGITSTIFASNPSEISTFTGVQTTVVVSVTPSSVPSCVAVSSGSVVTVTISGSLVPTSGATSSLLVARQDDIASSSVEASTTASPTNLSTTLSPNSTPVPDGTITISSVAPTAAPSSTFVDSCGVTTVAVIVSSASRPSAAPSSGSSSNSNTTNNGGSDNINTGNTGDDFGNTGTGTTMAGGLWARCSVPLGALAGAFMLFA